MNPHSLVAKMLKAKYFPRRDFLDVDVGSSLFFYGFQSFGEESFFSLG